MTPDRAEIFGGVDTHKQVHVAAGRPSGPPPSSHANGTHPKGRERSAREGSAGGRRQPSRDQAVAYAAGSEVKALRQPGAQNQ